MVTPGDHIDVDTLEELKEVMEDEFQVLIDTFLTDSEKRLAAIKSAIDSGIADELRSAAHSFKGSSSNIGAPRLAECLKKLEDMGREGVMDDAAGSLQQVEAEYRSVQEALKLLC